MGSELHLFLWAHLTFSKPPAFLHRWRQADDAANASERHVFKAAMTFMQGNGPAPSQDEWDHSMQLRTEANGLFKLAIAVVRPWPPHPHKVERESPNGRGDVNPNEVNGNLDVQIPASAAGLRRPLLGCKIFVTAAALTKGAHP